MSEVVIGIILNILIKKNLTDVHVIQQSASQQFNPGPSYNFL